ncbi:MAG TPA: GIY-YIG nuclease family protein [Candidatus Eremiobacteraceae bacterium]|nr:GIY-YIG nuclease family protein [Candidatus Eremiobacteraceae bacterium]
MKRERSAASHHVYLALTQDGSYYCGYAVDADARIAAHNAGRGAKILRGKRPVCLAYRRAFPSKTAAMRFEYLLKRRSHAQKRTLSLRWLARMS